MVKTASTAGGTDSNPDQGSKMVHVACSLPPPKTVAFSEPVESLNPIIDNLNYHI